MFSELRNKEKSLRRVHGKNVKILSPGEDFYVYKFNIRICVHNNT